VGGIFAHIFILKSLRITESFRLETILKIIELLDCICFCPFTTCSFQAYEVSPSFKKAVSKVSISMQQLLQPVRTQGTMGKSDKNLRNFNSFCYFCGVK